jgi:hypothetical protein
MASSAVSKTVVCPWDDPFLSLKKYIVSILRHSRYWYVFLVVLQSFSNLSYVYQHVIQALLRNLPGQRTVRNLDNKSVCCSAGESM